MSTVNTRSGVLLDLADPDPESVLRADIAAGLSGACRFAAQTEVFYSVAQHAVMVSGLVEEFAGAGGDNGPVSGGVLMAALHHDSHEAFMGDLPAPLKQMLPGYESIASRLDRAIHEAIGIRPEVLNERVTGMIHRADMVARCIEAEEVVPGGSEIVLGTAGDVSDSDLELGRHLWGEPVEAASAREMFVEREEEIHRHLLDQAGGAADSMDGGELARKLGVREIPLRWFSRTAESST